MKELLTEQKAKAYDLAIDAAKKYHNGTLKDVMETIFPELAESKDEMIRKEILEYFQQFKNEGLRGINISDWLAWLEKQGKQKPTTIDIDKMVDDYANNKERGNEEFGKPVNCMIRAYRQGLKDAIGKVVLKPTWSEEDEKIQNTTISFLSEYAAKGYENAVMCIDWLKSLKQRIGG